MPTSLVRLIPNKGIVIKTPNIPAWTNYPLAELLSKKYKVPAYIGNDANMAVLGEWLMGLGKAIMTSSISPSAPASVAVLSVATNLIEGFHGMATELGHITVLPDGPVCSCGVRGHSEAVASGSAIAKYVSEQIAAGRKSSLGSGVVTARLISEAARQGDELAKQAFIRAGEFIGQATADFLHMFNPSIVIFRWRRILSGDLLLDPVKDSVRRHVMDESYLDGLEITTAKLGDDAGLLGSLAQAHFKLAEH